MNPQSVTIRMHPTDIRMGKGWIRGLNTDIRIITNRIDGSRIHPDRHTTCIKLTLFAAEEESTDVINTIKSHFAEYNTSPLPTSLSNTNQETVYFHQLKRGS